MAPSSDNPGGAIPPDSYKAVDRLLVEVPEFDAGLDEHLGVYGELLPVLFFGDFAEFVQARLAAEPRNEELLGRCFAALDHLLTAVDREIATTLLATGFLEEFGDDDLRAMRGRFGPEMSRLVEMREHWAAEPQNRSGDDSP